MSLYFTSARNLVNLSWGIVSVKISLCGNTCKEIVPLPWGKKEKEHFWCSFVICFPSFKSIRLTGAASLFARVIQADIKFSFRRSFSLTKILITTMSSISKLFSYFLYFLSSTKEKQSSVRTQWAQFCTVYSANNLWNKSFVASPDNDSTKYNILFLLLLPWKYILDENCLQ